METKLQRILHHCSDDANLFLKHQALEPVSVVGRTKILAEMLKCIVYPINKIHVKYISVKFLYKDLCR